MKKITLGLIMLFTTTIFAQIAQGDIAFVGYNADGDDDFAIVALADIPASTTIYFTDSEPNATGTGMNDAGEGVITWTTGASLINAGTVITFTDLDNESNPSFGASVGTITRSKASIEFAVSGEELFATLGDPAADAVTVWLTGIEVHDDGRPANFDKTGLTAGTNYLAMDGFASIDGCSYKGVRTGKTVSEYKALINVYDTDQWNYDNSDGESLLPFDTTAFTFLTLSTPFTSVDEVVLSAKNGVITVNIGDVVAVYNMLGQQVSNQDLSQGVYMVAVKDGASIATYKFAL